MTISVSHPTDRPNFTLVDVDSLTIWFSYRTPIAFQADHGPAVVRQNEWSNTTGRHLNYVDGGDKTNRVDGETFARLLSEVTARLSEPVPVIG